MSYNIFSSKAPKMPKVKNGKNHRFFAQKTCLLICITPRSVAFSLTFVQNF